MKIVTNELKRNELITQGICENQIELIEDWYKDFLNSKQSIQNWLTLKIKKQSYMNPVYFFSTLPLLDEEEQEKKVKWNFNMMISKLLVSGKYTGVSYTHYLTIGLIEQWEIIGQVTGLPTPEYNFIAENDLLDEMFLSSNEQFYIWKENSVLTQINNGAHFKLQIAKGIGRVVGVGFYKDKLCFRSEYLTETEKIFLSENIKQIRLVLNVDLGECIFFNNEENEFVFGCLTNNLIMFTLPDLLKLEQ